MGLKIFRKKGKIDKPLPVKIKVGIFSEARYPRGTPVAAVAFYHEFGTGFQSETAFMRQGNNDFIKALPRIAKKDNLNIEKLAITWGNYIQLSVTRHGLIDTGKLRQSITGVVVNE